MTAFGVGVAHQADLALEALGDLPVRPADQRVGLDADAAQRGDRVLGRLGLQLTGRRDVGDQRDVQEEAVVPADLVPHLAGGLEEGQRLDVADGAADLGDDDVDPVRGPRRPARIRDLISLVMCGMTCTVSPRYSPRRSLAITSEYTWPVVTLARPDEVDVEEALVVADVQVGLGAVLGDEDLAVLERVHRPGIHVEVRVQLLHGDPEARGWTAARPANWRSGPCRVRTQPRR